MATPDIGAVATKKVGPLPIAAYAGIGIVALLIMRSKSATPTQSALATARSAVPLGGGQDATQAAPVSPQNTETFGSLLGGKSLGDFIGQLGPDYTGLSVHEGGMDFAVSHQNSAALLSLANIQGAYDLWKTQTQEAGASTRANIAGAYGLWGLQTAINGAGMLQNNSNWWQSILESHRATILAPGQTYVPPGYTGTVAPPVVPPVVPPGMSTTTPTSSTTPVVSGVTSPMPGNPPTPSAPSITCNSGNYSCIRGMCNAGNYSCARSVAPWLGNNRVW